MESDEFELRIDDRDQAVALPARGGVVEVMLGYEGQPLKRMGVYTVDEMQLSGPPDELTICGKASDMRGSGKTIRSGSWEGVPLSEIVTEIAKRNGWEVVCPVTTKVERIDQRNESDFNFVTRLARQYDSTAKVAQGKLLVMPRQGGKSTSGKSLQVITVNKTDVSRYQFRLSDRSTQKAVKTQHQDQKTGALKVVQLDNDESPDGLPPVHTDRHIYPNETAARQASKVWGIGRRMTAHLEAMDIRTAMDLAKADPWTLRRKFSVVVEKTARELAGTPCLELDEAEPPKQEICCSECLANG